MKQRRPNTNTQQPAAMTRMNEDNTGTAEHEAAVVKGFLCVLQGDRSHQALQFMVQTGGITAAL
jgi:hypothetical protein